MPYHFILSSNRVFATAFLVPACLAAFAAGCGDSGGGGTPQVESDLLGVYSVDQFQSSDDCTELMDADGLPRLVLYSATLNDDPDRAILVGEFCGTVDNCQARAEAGLGNVNYSFFDGDDTQGWLGYGIASQGFVGEQCRVDVQVHMLTTTSDQSIEIDTEQVETIYEGAISPDGGETTCGILDAIQSIDDESPCTGLFFVAATFEAELL